MEKKKYKIVRYIYLIDPLIRSFLGHYFNYAFSLLTAAKKKNMEFKLLANVDCDPAISAILPYQPVFQKDEPVSFLGIKLPKLAGLHRPFRRFQEWRRTCAGLNRDDGIVFVDNCVAIELFFFAIGLLLKHFRPAPVFMIMLRIYYYNPATRKWKKETFILKLAFLILEIASRGKRVYLVSDSELLALRFVQLTDLPIHTVPIPHTSSKVCAADKKNHRGLRFAYLGHGDYYKGITFLAEAIHHLHNEGRLNGMEMFIQCYQTGKADERINSALADLRNLKSTSITVVEHPLDEAQYDLEMDRADLLLFPYLMDRSESTSGPFTEALALGKPVIVSDRTWASEQLKRFDGGGIICQSANGKDLARAMTEAKQNYQNILEKSEKAKTAWRAFHNSDNFMETLFSISATCVA